MKDKEILFFKRIKISAVLLFVASQFWGCLQSPVAQKERQVVLRIPLASEPPTLDWNIATDNVSFRVITQIMEGLTSISPDGGIKPALAEKWEYNPDELSYTFYLKKGIKWSDGVPLTARHFVDSILRLLAPQTGSEYAYFVYDIKNARCYNTGKCSAEKVGVKASGKDIVKFYLEKPAVYFPYIVSFMVTFPIRKEIIQKNNGEMPPPPFPVVGAYVPIKWRHHYKIKLRFNDLYYGKKPEVKNIEFYVIEEPVTSLLLFENGFLNLAPIFPLAYDKYKKDKRFRKVTVFRGYYYGFNIKKEPFDSVYLRKAFAYATNREEVANLMRGTATPATSWIPPGMLGYRPDAGLKFDVKKAKKYLKKYQKITGEKDISIKIYFNASPENQLIAENIQSQWKRNLGINVELEMMEWNAYLQKLNSDPPGIFRLGWGADFPDPHNFMEIFASWSGNNHTNWSNKEFDALIKKGASEVDNDKRRKIYNRAQEILLEEGAVIIPLFFSTATYLTSEKFKNLELTPMDILSLKNVTFKR